MPYVTNDVGIERLAKNAERAGLSWSETWWRDSEELARRWEALGWPIEPDIAGGFDLGGCIGWFTYAVFEDSGPQWIIACVIPYGIAGYHHGQRIPARKLADLTKAIYQRMKDPAEHAMPPEPVNVGDRVASVSSDKSSRIGIAMSITSDGRVLTVQLEPNAPPEAAGQYARKWFAIHDERHKHFDKLWFSGQTEFPSYFTLRNKLGRRKQVRAEDGTPIYRGAPPVSAPSRPVAARAAPSTPAVLFPGYPAGVTDPLEYDLNELAEKMVGNWIDSKQMPNEFERIAPAIAHARKWLVENDKRFARFKLG